MFRDTYSIVLLYQAPESLRQALINDRTRVRTNTSAGRSSASASTSASSEAGRHRRFSFAHRPYLPPQGEVILKTQFHSLKQTNNNRLLLYRWAPTQAMLCACNTGYSKRYRQRDEIKPPITTRKKMFKR
jgi:hypothetical protein